MPSNDIDPVQMTQYNVLPNQVAKKPSPEPWELPDHGTPNLPPTLDRNDPFAIFSQFFTSEIIDKLVEWTNKYAELHPSNDAGEKPWASVDAKAKYGCSVCQIPFCREGECWLPYIERLNSKE